MPRPTPQLLRLAALAATAGLCAMLANALARPDHKLSWRAMAPPPAPVPVPALAVAPQKPLAPPLPPPPAPTSAAPSRTAAPPAPGPASRLQPSPTAAVRAISAPDAWLAYELKVPFLDARRSAAFTEGHILGAWSAPVWEADVDTRLTEFEARANPGPRDPIVIYCDGGGCEDSHLLANKLVALGYRNLLIYTDGFPDWTAQGRPVAKGARP